MAVDGDDYTYDKPAAQPHGGALLDTRTADEKIAGQIAGMQMAIMQLTEMVYGLAGEVAILQRKGAVKGDGHDCHQ